MRGLLRAASTTTKGLISMHQSEPTRVSRRDLLMAVAATGAVAATAPVLGRTGRAAPATPTPISGPDRLFRDLRVIVAQRMAELKIPGVAVGVIAGGEELAAGFGVTNVDHPLPVAADTLFQIGSITKTYTGTAIMRLVEQGKLDLEAPVRDYLPDFRVADPNVSEHVQLRHLVTHSAGWFGDGFTDTGDGDDALARDVAGMADLPQIAPLGEYFSYNNAAVALAGRVIEVVSGETYEVALADLVLRPLGLERSFFFAEEIMTESFTVGHLAPPDDPDGPPLVSPQWAIPRSQNPSGGLVSSVTDLLRFARFHLGDGTVGGARVLSPEGIQRMRTPHGPGGSVGPNVLDGVGVNWQLWSVGGARVVGHGGGGVGQQSGLVLVPEREFALAVLTNADAGAALGQELTEWALEQFLGLIQPPPATISVPPERLAEYAGDFAAGDGSAIFRVGTEGAALRLDLLVAGQGEPVLTSPLKPVGDDLVIAEFLGLTIYADFVRNAAGEIGWLRFLGRLAPRST